MECKDRKYFYNGTHHGECEQPPEKCPQCMAESLKTFEVTWTIKLKRLVKASNIEEANEIIENIDCQHEGRYVEDSFDIVKTEEVERVNNICYYCGKETQGAKIWVDICDECLKERDYNPENYK